MAGTTIPREQDASDRVADTRQTTLRLVYARGRRASNALFTVDEDATIGIGREPPAGGIVVGDDGWASRHHATVTRPIGDELMVVEDLGSRNGTFIDGQRIAPKTRIALAPGQVLRVGATVFVAGLRPASATTSTPAPADFVVNSPAMATLWERLAIIAASDERVLIVGEIGSGKTAIARLMHNLSRRAPGPFIAHNASAIPPNLEDATLFGVAAGFIPGVSARVGLVAQADGGTLFLDELGDLPAPAQAKLLDAFDPNEPSFMPVGAPKRVPTRCRLVVAVQRDIFELVAEGRIRHDLASRFAVARLDVPPLRLRREDIMTLFDASLRRYAPKTSLEEVVREPEIAEALLLSHWSENVRGLESLARRVGLAEVLTAELVKKHADRGMARPTPTPLPSLTPEPKAQTKRTLIWPPEPAELLELLAAHDFEVTPVAELFGRARETVGRHLTKTFGPGGKDVIKRVYREWLASGRID